MRLKLTRIGGKFFRIEEINAREGANFRNEKINAIIDETFWL